MREERRTQLLARTEQPRERRALREAEYVGDFLAGIAEQHLQYQRLPIVRIERENGCADLGEIVRVRCGRRRAIEAARVIAIERPRTAAPTAARSSAFAAAGAAPSSPLSSSISTVSNRLRS